MASKHGEELKRLKQPFRVLHLVLQTEAIEPIAQRIVGEVHRQGLGLDGVFQRHLQRGVLSQGFDGRPCSPAHARMIAALYQTAGASTFAARAVSRSADSLHCPIREIATASSCSPFHAASAAAF